MIEIYGGVSPLSIEGRSFIIILVIDVRIFRTWLKGVKDVTFLSVVSFIFHYGPPRYTDDQPTIRRPTGSYLINHYQTNILNPNQMLSYKCPTLYGNISQWGLCMDKKSRKIAFIIWSISYGPYAYFCEFFLCPYIIPIVQYFHIR